MIVPLTEGDMIPDFKTIDEKGITYSSASLKGQMTLFYFYPRDNTPGCSLQACDLRDTYQQFKEIPVSILGSVSYTHLTLPTKQPV